MPDWGPNRKSIHAVAIDVSKVREVMLRMRLEEMNEEWYGRAYDLGAVQPKTAARWIVEVLAYHTGRHGRPTKFAIGKPNLLVLR